MHVTFIAYFVILIYATANTVDIGPNLRFIVTNLLNLCSIILIAHFGNKARYEASHAKEAAQAAKEQLEAVTIDGGNGERVVRTEPPRNPAARTREEDDLIG